MKKKSIIKRIFLIFGITAGILLFLVIAFFVWIIITTPKENVTDVEWSFSSSLTINSFGGETDTLESLPDLSEKDFYEELKWYDTLEEAIEDDSMLEYKEYKKYVLSTEFFRIEFEDRLIIFHLIPNGDNKKQELISYIVFARKGDKISQPYVRLGYLPVPGMGDRQFIYDCDDAVVDYIFFELFSDRALTERGLRMFFGTWPDKEELESLTLAGEKLQLLDKPIVVNGETYYFWYLTELMWCERLTEISWSKFTYGQIIEALDIQYEPSQTEEDGRIGEYYNQPIRANYYRRSHGLCKGMILLQETRIHFS